MNWNARAIYVIVALVMTLGLLLVPTTASVLGNGINPDLFKLEPSLALNVKGAIEKFTITYDGSTKLPAVNITGWSITSAWMTSSPRIVDGGNPGDTWVRIQAAEPGEAHITVDLDFNGDGIVDLTLDAEKKWGEINCTELTSKTLGDSNYLATELVKANFIWGPASDIPGGTDIEVLPADDAVISWWLMDIGALAEIEDIEADLGHDPCDEDGGCGDWVWDPTLDEDAQPNNPLNLISWAQNAHPVDHSTAWLYDGSVGTAIDANKDYATSTSDVDGTADIMVYAASAKTVLLVTLAEYPMDYHGENIECVQHETFKPVIPSAQVKSPQLRWAGEKLVLEKDWGKHPYFERGCIFVDKDDDFYYVPLEDHETCEDIEPPSGTRWVGEYIDARVYIAIYSLEEGSIGSLEPINDIGYIRIDMPWDDFLVVYLDSIGLPAGAQQVIAPLGGGLYHAFGDDPYGELWWNSVSQAIVCTEQSGEVDVTAGLYEVGLHFEDLGVDTNADGYYVDEVWFEGPIDNHGFLAYFLEFEEVVLTDVDEGALTDITPASDLAGVSSDESVDVAVQVKGFFDYRHSHLMATTRPEKLLDLDQPGDPGYGLYDVKLPEGRYVLPDDWWLLAGTKDVSLRPNWDMMDMADQDSIDSLNELGPYDGVVGNDVQTTDPPGEAEYPTIGPFSTLQTWSSDLQWVTQATVPGSVADRNTVVPDGEDLNWYDAPMPQALVTFKVIDSDDIVNHSLSGLDKGDLYGYGYTGSPKVYHSPYYEVEIPAHWAIPAGYDWDSWGGWGPYPFWTDLGIKSSPLDEEPDEVNDQDVEVYCDNHGIAGVTVDALEAQGSLEITATADYPYAPLRGKYGPRVSSPITIGSRTDLNPHFVVDKIEVAVGETVTFDPTSTYGGSLPYTHIKWDFDGDNSWDLELTGSWMPATLPIATWHYDAEGEYYPCLEITDSSAPSPVVRTECMSDPYSIVVGAGVTKIPWNLPWGLNADAAAVNIWTYPNQGVEVTLAAVDATMPTGLLIWYYGGPAVGWKFYKKGWGATNTLTSLVPGESYIGIVPTASVWDIPQV
jgi:hypothetical protein